MHDDARASPSPQIAKHPRLTKRNGWNIESSLFSKLRHVPAASLPKPQTFAGDLRRIWPWQVSMVTQFEFGRLLPLKGRSQDWSSNFPVLISSKILTYALMFHHNSSLKPRWTSFKTQVQDYTWIFYPKIPKRESWGTLAISLTD